MEHYESDIDAFRIRCSEQEIEIMFMKKRLSSLECENIQLKQHIAHLAMENCDMMPKMRKLSKGVVGTSTMLTNNL